MSVCVCVWGVEFNTRGWPLPMGGPIVDLCPRARGWGEPPLVTEMPQFQIWLYFKMVNALAQLLNCLPALSSFHKIKLNFCCANFRHRADLHASLSQRKLMDFPAGCSARLLPSALSDSRVLLGCFSWAEEACASEHHKAQSLKFCTEQMRKTHGRDWIPTAVTGLAMVMEIYLQIHNLM